MSNVGIATSKVPLGQPKLPTLRQRLALWLGKTFPHDSAIVSLWQQHRCTHWTTFRPIRFACHSDATWGINYNYFSQKKEIV